MVDAWETALCPWLLEHFEQLVHAYERRVELFQVAVVRRSEDFLCDFGKQGISPRAARGGATNLSIEQEEHRQQPRNDSGLERHVSESHVGRIAAAVSAVNQK